MRTCVPSCQSAETPSIDRKDFARRVRIFKCIKSKAISKFDLKEMNPKAIQIHSEVEKTWQFTPHACEHGYIVYTKTLCCRVFYSKNSRAYQKPIYLVDFLFWHNKPSGMLIDSNWSSKSATTVPHAQCTWCGTWKYILDSENIFECIVCVH